MPLTKRSVRLARWSVYYRRKGKWKRRKFEEDFPAALKFRDSKLDLDPATTLHCDNVGFPPPRHITHAEREEWEIIRKRVKVKGVKTMKKFKRRIVVVYNKMDEYNRQGIWWCPYCIKLRRFKEIDTEEGRELCCPVCWASHRIVKEYNPLSLNLEQRGRHGQ